MVASATPQCADCIHFDEEGEREGLTCDAFLKGIPEEILYGEHDHRKPFPGDKGILFEPKKKGR
jgi:hypothetical protein